MKIITLMFDFATVGKMLAGPVFSNVHTPQLVKALTQVDEQHDCMPCCGSQVMYEVSDAEGEHVAKLWQGVVQQNSAADAGLILVM